MAKYRTKKLREYFDQFTDKQWNEVDVDGTPIPISKLKYSNQKLIYNLYACCYLVYPGKQEVEATKENVYYILKQAESILYNNKIQDIIK
jgi:hypothetical protein